MIGLNDGLAADLGVVGVDAFGSGVEVCSKADSAGVLVLTGANGLVSINVPHPLCAKQKSS